MGRILAAVAALLIITVFATQVLIVRAGEQKKSVAAAAGEPSPKELGRVEWVRGFKQGTATARRNGRPMLVLFQEVPGCATCVNYGNDVLSHPLIVESAETLFTPVAVYNNVAGEDALTLKSFDEPSWNNPVVRIVDVDRSPLAPRLAKDYTVAGLASAMVAALEKKGRPVPAYLSLLAEEHASHRSGLETATFAMHCFWEGEGALGQIPGVVKTRPGFLNKEEVVEVEYDPSRISFDSLLGRAKAMECASTVYARNEAQQRTATNAVGKSKAIRTDDAIRIDNAPKYYLAQTPLKFVPMTELQAARVNAAIGEKKNPAPLLSPRQQALLATIEKHPDAGWNDAVGTENLIAAWAAAQTVARARS